MFQKMLQVGNGGGSSMDNYSTEEMKIGTWTDGKPLYRKVYEGTFASGSNINFGANFLTDYHVKKIVRMSSMASGSDPSTQMYYNGGSDYFRVYYSQTNKTFNLSRGSSYPTVPFNYTVIVEYTKTTD